MNSVVRTTIAWVVFGGLSTGLMWSATQTTSALAESTQTTSVEVVPQVVSKDQFAETVCPMLFEEMVSEDIVRQRGLAAGLSEAGVTTAIYEGTRRYCPIYWEDAP